MGAQPHGLAVRMASCCCSAKGQGAGGRGSGGVAAAHHVHELVGCCWGLLLALWGLLMGLQKQRKGRKPPSSASRRAAARTAHLPRARQHAVQEVCHLGHGAMQDAGGRFRGRGHRPWPAWPLAFRPAADEEARAAPPHGRQLHPGGRACAGSAARGAAGTGSSAACGSPPSACRALPQGGPCRSVTSQAAAASAGAAAVSGKQGCAPTANHSATPPCTSLACCRGRSTSASQAALSRATASLLPAATTSSMSQRRILRGQASAWSELNARRRAPHVLRHVRQARAAGPHHPPERPRALGEGACSHVRARRQQPAQAREQRHRA